MLKVSKIKNYDEFEKNAIQIVARPIEKAIEKSYEEIPKKYFTRLKWWYWFIGILTSPILIGIVMIMLSISANKLITETVKSKINLLEIYQELWQVGDPFLRLENVENDVNNNIDKFKGSYAIPADAIRIRSSLLFSGSIRSLPTKVSTSTFRWQRGNGKNVQTFLKEIGLLEIDINSLENEKDWSFNMINRIGPKLNNVITENKKFNKVFDLESDNQIKARMYATPLTTEMYLDHLKNNVSSREIGILKKGKKIYICFVPYKNDAFNLNFKIKNSITEMVRLILSDLINDTYEIYALYAFLLIPPFLPENE
ncbi:uncharacterized protein DUF3137 [Mycoplasma testudineum]|uniref:Uncharacterized protein DUF3137 n=1 Tax=Mycoplasma testudineum TaxID=244584 RepID=A0A4R6IDX1_9MOLU|nr:DUF3137 domain-containing protein [Mycoplasma testudineum]OYD26555.1 hypothetical protein CG473_03550 [Mycoplasma testudineum]TDO19105.1 uncharacterized protein DUF3137 [Mycoplasma testudineum]